MGRILAIDYGKKRCGIAVTDPLKIIATGLTTVEAPQLMNFLKSYIQKETVEEVIVGLPVNLDDSDTDSTAAVRHFIKAFEKHCPGISITPVDERFSSKRAAEAMVDMGMKKKQRQNKAMVDEISAALLLQDYLSKF